MTHDVFFLGYDETNIDKHFGFLQDRVPRAKKVGPIEGILEAHHECARLSTSDHFFLVDADADVSKHNFKFEFEDPRSDTVYVWAAENPINGLTYGYGGIKLFSVEVILALKSFKGDMISNIRGVSLSDDRRARVEFIDEVSCITRFNTSAFETWRSAFRECANLKSVALGKVRSTMPQDMAREFLKGWCDDRSLFGDFGSFCIAGAIQGQRFAEENDNIDEMNDFGWLRNEFESTFDDRNSNIRKPSGWDLM